MGVILITGASGFIGRYLSRELLAKGGSVRGVVRDRPRDPSLPAGVEPAFISDLGPCTEWRDCLRGVETVIHLAARVHVLAAGEPQTGDSFQKVNVAGTRSLVEAAAAAGVRRFVLISSIKAMAESTPIDRPLTELSACAPVDPYGISKLQAEKALWETCRRSAMEGVVFRLPLVYGPGVRANMRQLLALVDKGIPLPLGMVVNRRSFLFVGNLTDVIARALTHPRAGGHTFLVSDNEDLSTPALIRLMGAKLGRRVTLLPVPVSLLRAGGHVADTLLRLAGGGGRQVGPMVHRLVESLAVMPGHCMETLDWQPPFSPAEGMARTVAWLREEEG